MAIRTIRHKGLLKLHQTGNPKGVSADLVDKLENMLAVLDDAQTIEQVALFPGWKLHPLKGELKGCWAMTLSKNWRLIFRFIDGEAHDLDLVDYH